MCVYIAATYHTVDGNQKSGNHSAVEVGSEHLPLFTYRVFFNHHPVGGWPQDF